jgi:hypothetical protein
VGRACFYSLVVIEIIFLSGIVGNCHLDFHHKCIKLFHPRCSNSSGVNRKAKFKTVYLGVGVDVAAAAAGAVVEEAHMWEPHLRTNQLLPPGTSRQSHNKNHNINITTTIRRATATTKKRNWRMAKRRKMRELQGGEKLALKKEINFNHQMSNMTTYINKESHQLYGFISSRKRPGWQNNINALKTIHPDMLELRQPSNRAFHNLSYSQLPMGTHQLLGISRPSPAIDNTISRMQRSIRIQHWISQITTDMKDAKSNYIPGM